MEKMTLDNKIAQKEQELQIATEASINKWKVFEDFVRNTQTFIRGYILQGFSWRMAKDKCDEDYKSYDQGLRTAYENKIQIEYELIALKAQSEEQS